MFCNTKRNDSFSIVEEGTYIPLLNDSTVITSDFLAKLKRATNTRMTPKLTKGGKYGPHSPDDEGKKRRSLKTVFLAASLMNKNNS